MIGRYNRIWKWVLSKNGLRIALGRLVKVLEIFFFDRTKQKRVLSKNGLRIAVAGLVKLLENFFWDKKKKVSTFQKWS